MDKTIVIERWQTGHTLVESALAEWHATDQNTSAPDRWSAQDTLAHLTFWEARWVNWLEGKPLDARGPRHIQTFEDEDQVNAAILSENRSRTWEDVLYASRQVWARMPNLVHLIPEDDFDRSARFAWLKGVPLWRRLFRTFYWHPEAHVIDAALARERSERAKDIAKEFARFAGGVELAPERGTAIYNLACLYARIGQTADAIGELERAFAFNPELVEWSKQDHDLDPLRHRAEFQAMISPAASLP